MEIRTHKVLRDPATVALELRALHAWALMLNELDPYMRETVLSVDAGLQRQMDRVFLGGGDAHDLRQPRPEVDE